MLSTSCHAIINFLNRIPNYELYTLIALLYRVLNSKYFYIILYIAYSSSTMSQLKMESYRVMINC